MGFQYAVVFFTPSRWAARDHPPALPLPGHQPPPLGEGPLWRPAGLINAGSATSMGVLTDPSFAHCDYGSRGRAAICLANALFRRLAPLCAGSPRSRFAPPFAVELPSDELAWHPNAEQSLEERCRRGEVASGSEWALPLEVIEYHDETVTVPSGEAIAKHNAALALDDCDFRELVDGERFDPTLGYRRDRHPMLWASCTELGSWLRELADGNEKAAQVLREDPVAAGLVRGWAGLAEGLATTDARALILFEGVRVPSLA